MKYLGKQVKGSTRELDLWDWDREALGTPPMVRFNTKEFTHICPVTEQPDFCDLTIYYQPDEKLIETKSLKMYLQSYRDHKAFDEQLVCQIAKDLVEQVRPLTLTVIGVFTSRGGISVRAEKTINAFDPGV